MEIDKRILALLIIIAILSIGLAFSLLTHQENNKQTPVNNTTITNKTVNATLNETNSESTSSSSENGQYGYCAICGNALTYEEAHSEYTQGKVCHSCASNPYYQSGEGADYANKKLYEAYPDEYGWMHEDNDNNKNNFETNHNERNNLNSHGNTVETTDMD